MFEIIRCCCTQVSVLKFRTLNYSSQLLLAILYFTSTDVFIRLCLPVAYTDAVTAEHCCVAVPGISRGTQRTETKQKYRHVGLSQSFNQSD